MPAEKLEIQFGDRTQFDTTAKRVRLPQGQGLLVVWDADNIVRALLVSATDPAREQLITEDVTDFELIPDA